MKGLSDECVVGKAGIPRLIDALVLGREELVIIGGGGAGGPGLLLFDNVRERECECECIDLAIEPERPRRPEEVDPDDGVRALEVLGDVGHREVLGLQHSLAVDAGLGHGLLANGSRVVVFRVGRPASEHPPALSLGGTRPSKAWERLPNS